MKISERRQIVIAAVLAVGLWSAMGFSMFYWGFAATVIAILFAFGFVASVAMIWSAISIWGPGE